MKNTNLFATLYKRYNKLKKYFAFAEIKWTLPEKCDVVIYDKTGSDEIFKYLIGFKVDVLEARGESLNIPACILMFFNSIFWKGKYLESYFISYIKIASPKIVITYIDNDSKFYFFSKYLPNSKTIIIQNGVRTPFESCFSNKISSDNCYVDHMLLFNEAIAEKFRKIISGNIETIGSLINNEIEISGLYEEGTVLFISQYRDPPTENMPFIILNEGVNISWKEFYATEENLINYLQKWCFKNHYKLNISGCNSKNMSSEYFFFQNTLYGTKCIWEYFPRENRNSSYELIDSAELVIFVDSTLGYESIARGKKSAAFSRYIPSINQNYCRFAWPADLPDHGPFWSNDCTQQSVFRVMDDLSKMTFDSWREICSKYTDIIIPYNFKNYRLKSLLNKLLYK